MARDPRQLGMRLVKVREPPLKFLQSLRAMQINFIHRLSGKVQMRILKSRNDQPSLQVDGDGVGACKCLDLRRRSHRQNLVMGDCKSFSLRALVVTSPDLSVHENPVNM